MVFYVKQPNGRGKRIYAETCRDDEVDGDYEANSIDVPLFWEGSRIHPTSTGLPRNVEKNLPIEAKEDLKESALGEEQGDAEASQLILQEGWAILGSWGSNDSWETDGSGSNSSQTSEWGF